MTFTLFGIVFDFLRGLLGNVIRQHPERLACLQRPDIVFGGALEIIEPIERIGGEEPSTKTP